MADVFSTGVWKSLGELESEELQRLASTVSTSALQCKAVSATKNTLEHSSTGKHGQLHTNWLSFQQIQLMLHSICSI